MSSYLPKDGGSGSAYQEGGGLYALGKYLGAPYVILLQAYIRLVISL